MWRLPLRPVRPVLSSLLGLALSAQAPPGSVQAGIEAGRQAGATFPQGSTEMFAGPVDMKGTSIKGFWLGTRLKEDWSLEVSVRRASTTLSAPGAGLDYAAMELTGVRSWRRGRFEPYLQAGAGIVNLDINVADKAYRDANRLSLAAGGGGLYWAAPWCALRCDLRAHAAHLESGRWLRTSEITAGVQVSFGGGL